MKLLLIAGVAVLSFLFASVDRLAGPGAGAQVPWASSVPIHSPR